MGRVNALKRPKLMAGIMFVDAKSLTKWDYAGCPFDADPLQFGPFENIVMLWRSKIAREVDLPDRKDFDFFDFKGWWGKISIAKIESDPFDIRFVLWGTQLTNWWGVDYTNKLMGTQSITPELWQTVESAYFKAMVDEPFIGVVCGSLDQHDRPFVKVLGVDLPMKDGSGGMSVLSAYIEVTQSDTAASVLPKAVFNRAF